MGSVWKPKRGCGHGRDAHLFSSGGRISRNLAYDQIENDPMTPHLGLRVGKHDQITSNYHLLKIAIEILSFPTQQWFMFMFFGELCEFNRVSLWISTKFQPFHFQTCAF